MSTFLQRMVAGPEPVQPELPLPPQHDPANIIPGPRIRLRYGSAATEICTRCRVWRDTRVPSERWRSVSDYRHIDNVIGKLVEVKNAFNPPYRGVAGESDDDGGGLTIDGKETFLSLSHVTVVSSDEHLNAFEQALKEHADAEA